MRVLLVTYYWPPAGGSGVQRWLKFVKYLPEFGIEPVVYTVKDPKYPVLDESLENELNNDVEVIRKEIWEPGNLFQSSKKGKQQQGAGFLNPNPSLGQRLIHYIRANYFIPDARKFWIAPSVKFLKEYLKDNPVELMISTGPPHSLHLICKELNEKLGIKWMADFRDPWTEIDYFHNLPLTKRSLMRHRAMENSVLSSADHVLVVGQGMKGDFKSRCKSISVLTNGYDTGSEKVNKVLDDIFSISHIGMMNADRNPDAFWRAISELMDEIPGFDEHLIIQLVGHCAPEVFESVNYFGLTDHVRFIGYVPHQRVLQYQQCSQLLLLAVNRVPSAKNVVTGKVFEYMQSKRPVLGIGPEDGDVARILNETGAGKMTGFDNVNVIKAFVKDSYEAFLRGELRVESRGIERYHRRNLTAELVTDIKRIVNGS